MYSSASLGMYLAPEIPDIQACRVMKAEIEHASQEYVEAPYFREVAPVAAEGISASITATASLLLRGVGKNARVFDARISDAGLRIHFSDALHAGKFIRTMKQAGYQTACLQWMQPDETNGGCAATKIFFLISSLSRSWNGLVNCMRRPPSTIKKRLPGV